MDEMSVGYCTVRCFSSLSLLCLSGEGQWLFSTLRHYYYAVFSGYSVPVVGLGFSRPFFPAFRSACLFLPLKQHFFLFFLKVGSIHGGNLFADFVCLLLSVCLSVFFPGSKVSLSPRTCVQPVCSLSQNLQKRVYLSQNQTI